MKSCHVAVVMGGISPEHEISLRSGSTVLANLDQARYSARAVIIQRNGRWSLPDGVFDPGSAETGAEELYPEEAMGRLRKWGVNVAFLALHGPNGEDGLIQGFFQTAGIPFTGPGLESSALCMNKKVAKVLVADQSISVPPDRVLTRAEWNQGEEEVVEQLVRDLHFPMYVKSLRSGSSLGVDRVENQDVLGTVLSRHLSREPEVLVEEGIKGKELTCAVLGVAETAYRALEPVLIEPVDEFFNYECKYDPDKVKEHCPAYPKHIDENLQRAVMETSVRVAEILGTCGIVRADFMFDEEKLWFLELNTIPGLTPQSIVLKEVEEDEMSLEKLLDQIIEMAMGAHSRELKRQKNLFQEGW